MFAFEWIEEQLREMSQSGLLRQPADGVLREAVREGVSRSGGTFVDASSNDYLGYGRRALEHATPALAGVADVSRETEAAGCDDRERFDALTTGACSSRLLGGTRAQHLQLERALADWVQQDTALLFSSGYAANVGLMSSLPGGPDVIFSDQLNHASIVDGCRLSRASVVVYPHRDPDALRTLMLRTKTTGRRFIVTESYFSMDGDSPDLAHLRALADEFGAALIVDEAHALGVFGPQGSGIAASQDAKPDIIVGTLGKAVGLQGAFVAGPAPVQQWLWNRARSFVYSTASVPMLAHLALLHVKQIRSDEAGRRLLLDRSALLRSCISELGFQMPIGSHGPIVPVILRDNESAIAAAERLRSLGVLAYPLRPPTVPPGTARLRLTVSSGVSQPAFDHLLRSVTSALLPFARQQV